MNKGRVCVRLSVLIVSVLLVLTTSYSQVFAEDQCPAGGDHEYTITVVRHAASDAEGLRRYTCNKCDYSYTESIPATGHRWGSWNVAKAATKSAEGLRCRVCMNDPDHVEYASISVLPAGPKPNIGGGVILGGNQTRTGDQPGAGTDNDKKSKHKPGGNGGGNEGGGSGSDSIVPLGAADVAIVGANGAASIFFIILLLPLIKVMFWIAKKRREAEEDQ